MLEIMSDCLLTPLTCEMFGEKGDRVLRGEVQNFSIRGIHSDGHCLKVDDELFIHPTLFHGMRRDSGFRIYVQVTLRDGMLKMQKYDPRNKRTDPDVKAAWDEPVQLRQTAVDNIIELAKRAEWQKHCARTKGYECEGARERMLDFRRSVLVLFMGQSSPTVLCGACFDKERAQDPTLSERVLLDGRKVLYHQPVSILA